MSTLFIILLVLGCLALIGFPLFRGSNAELLEETRPVKSNIARNKEIVMSTLGEIEFDYHMKKLSDEDYQTLKNNYAGAAVAIMKEEESAGQKARTKRKTKVRTKGDVNTLKSIEQEIEEDLKSLADEGRSHGQAKCHRCGAQLKARDQEYCHSCGERQF